MESSAYLVLLLIVGSYGVNGARWRPAPFRIFGDEKTPTRAEFHNFEDSERRSSVSTNFLSISFIYWDY